MRTSEALTRARELIAGGWNEPFSVDAAGEPCHAEDEGVTRFCVDDALRIACGGDIERAVALEQVLQRTLRLTGCREGLSTWLQHETRHHAEVLVLLGRARLHAVAEESRHV